MKRGAPMHSTAYLREAMGDSYFQWLADEVASHNNKDYWRLMRALHRKEFYYINKRDSMLSDDGLYLRYMYKRNYRDYENNNPVLPSCLEVLLSLAMRLESSLVDITYQDWFWIFLTNLDLDLFDDDSYDEQGGTDKINYILSMWLTRQYKHDGSRFNIFSSVSGNYDLHELDILNQGYLYIRENYGPGLVYDLETHQPL